MARGLRGVLRRLNRALGGFERNLKGLYGGAQVDPDQMGTQAPRSAGRLDGVSGRYEVRRDSAGHTYLVQAPPPERSPER